MKLKKYASLIFTLAIIVWAIIYITQHFDEVKGALTVSVDKIVILLFLELIVIVINGYTANIILQSFKVNLNFHEWFGLSTVTTMGNLLFPFRGGMGIRALYLKKRFKFPITLFLSTVAASYVVSLMIHSLIGMISFGLLYYYQGIFNVPIFILFFAVFVGLLFFIFLSPKLPKFQNKWLSVINTVIDGWQSISKNHILLSRLTLLFLVSSFAGIFGIYCSFQALSINITVLQASIVAILNSFTTLINITPGAMGLSEVVIAFSSRLFGVILSQGILAAALRRGVILLLVFTLGPIYSFLLIGRKNMILKYRHDLASK